nr:AAA family ATPase [uncultured Acetatifactor sp.]
MKNIEQMERIIQYMEAGFPILYINTYEEKNTMEMLRETAVRITGRKKIIEWNLTTGYSEYLLNERKYQVPPQNCTFTQVMQILSAEDYEDSLFIIRDISSLLDSPEVVAYLKELSIRIGTDIESNIILLSAVVKIPKELENFITILDMGYPSEEEIEKLIQEFCSEQGTKAEESLIHEMAVTFKGLTESEVIGILSLAMSDDGKLGKNDMSLVFEQKQQKIRKSGIMDMIPLKEKMEDIGGLENLKTWLGRKATVMKDLRKAEEFGVSAPKGVLIAGLPGCGKSLTAKAAASLFQIPLLRMDMGRLMGKYVGESEENLRKALALAEAISPCVLWVDELEKAFAGIGGSGGGAEVTTRLFGNFLTWLQEKDAPVFVVATANNVSKLPPEFLRKGRFDEIYYVGLPKEKERKQIFNIHIKKRRPKELHSIDLDRLAQATEGYCGADIESVVADAVEEAFVKGRDSVKTEDFLAAIRNTNSLSDTMKESLKEMEETYKKNHFRKASL